MCEIFEQGKCILGCQALKDLKDIMLQEIKKLCRRLSMKIYRAEIDLKLPSCNEYINACRYNKYKGAKMKKDIEEKISYYLRLLPNFTKPVKIKFIWIEGTKKRDLDGICFAKKFILDSMVKCGKLQDDNRKIVTGFTDEFEYADSTKVILEIEELENG